MFKELKVFVSGSRASLQDSYRFQLRCLILAMWRCQLFFTDETL